MRRQNEFLRLQQQVMYSPEVRVTNVQIWPKNGAMGDRVRLSKGLIVSIRAHAVNAGGSTAYLCQRESSCALAHMVKGSVALPMFKPYKNVGIALARLKRPHVVDHYDSTEMISELNPGDFGFWQFDYVVGDDFSEGDVLHVMGLVAYWDAKEQIEVTGIAKLMEIFRLGNGLRAVPRTRRRLIAFAKRFHEEEQIFSSVDAAKNPDYEYVE